MNIPAYENLLERYKASCRVDAKQARGSCTIIYSKGGETYALTNFHVIEQNLQYKEVWDPLLQKDTKKEFKEAVEILYPRLNGDRILGFSTVIGDVVIQDKQQDIALLKFRDIKDFPSVEWYPHEEAKDVPVLTPLTCIGAALGLKPIATFGNLNGVQIEIDNYEYWMSSAPSIFGNSGGGLFALKEDTWYFIGIPSRISVIPSGFGGAQAITHMGYFIPLFRIYKWLEENCYQFLYDNEFTPEKCEKLREEKKSEETLRGLMKNQ